MDRDTLNLAQSVLEELEGVLAPIGMELRRVDLKDSGGVPTVLISRPGKDEEAIVCSAVPRTLGGMGVMFLQFYASLTPQALREQWEQLERFARESNRRFLMGTLLTRDGRLELRFVLPQDPAVGMDEDHIQTAVAAFAYEMALFARLGSGILNGSMTVEQALEYRE